MLNNLDRYSPAALARFGSDQVGGELHAISATLARKEPEVFTVGHSGFRVFIKDGWSVLDVGSGHNPHPRATVLLDRQLGPHEERSGKSAVRDARPLVVADAECLPFTDHAFDYVIASHIAEHMPDPTAFCRELARVAQGGYIECPGPLSELVLGEPFHLWVVQPRGDMLIFKPNPPKSWLVQRLSDAFYALFYAGRQRSRPTWQPRSRVARYASAKLQRFLQRAWSSRLLRRWTWTCYPFAGEVKVLVREG